MGLNKRTQKPCGFAFVEFNSRHEAELALDTLNAAKIDLRQIRIDWDYGFRWGRQYGRGRSGGQVRDEFLENEDKERPKYRPRENGEGGFRNKRQKTGDQDNDNGFAANEETKTTEGGDDPWTKLQKEDTEQIEARGDWEKSSATMGENTPVVVKKDPWANNEELQASAEASTNQ